MIAKLTTMCAGFDSDFPFTMVVDDPSGNSFVENPSAPNKDPALSVSYRYISRKMIGGISASCSCFAMNIPRDVRHKAISLPSSGVSNMNNFRITWNSCMNESLRRGAFAFRAPTARCWFLPRLSRATRLGEATFGGSAE